MTPEATTVGMWVIGLAAVIGGLLVVGRFVLALVRGARRVGHFFDDWFGEPARDGHPPRPGIPARIASLEESSDRMCNRLSTVESQITTIDHELHPNAGGSLRDAVDRIEKRSTAHPTVQQTFVAPPAEGEE